MPPPATFHRPPRDHPPAVPTEEVRIVPPPALSLSRGELVQTLFPVVGSFGMVLFALAYHNKTFLYIAFAMCVLSVGFAVGLRAVQRHGSKKRIRTDRRRYRKYLAQQAKRLDEIVHLQRQAAERLYPDPARLWALAVQRRHLWERRPADRDFLLVRLGKGTVPLACPLTLAVSEDPLAEHEPDLLREAQTMVRKRARLRNQPVVETLDRGTIALTGDRDRARALVRYLLAQLAVFRAPRDLRVLAAFPGARRDEWEWVKWLPHAHAGAGAGLMLAPDPMALADLLEREVAPRIEQLRRHAETPAADGAPRLVAPELVLVVDDFAPSAPPMALPLFREVLERGRELKVTVLLLTDDTAHEPSDIDARLVVPPRGPGRFELPGAGGPRREEIWLDGLDVGSAEAIARTLTPVRLEEQAGAAAPTDDVRLLDLVGLRSATDVDPGRDWRPRPRAEELRVPIGVDGDGEPVVLDLKESADGGLGPHGLIVGATGSGKSELLRTLVTGLAMRHAPETLAFVLVDFKGGAAFAELSRLPHTAGLITNLQSDLSLVDRMHEALYGEQARRQALLRAAGNVDDIKAYRARREADPTLPPMPYLLVIVDEFSELLTSRPDFIELFTAIGRVGRSLGIHLLFSSQRLEEGKLRGLEGHLRYRICLRTYNAGESRVVLGTPDAYLLPPIPGMGYLKVDTSVYDRFKAALITTPHREPEELAGPVAEVRPFAVAADGAPAEAASDPAADAGGPAEMEVIVSRLAREREGIDVHQVWTAPLEPALPLDAVLPGPAWWSPGSPSAGDAGLTVPVGLLDLPAEQRQEPLALDFAGTAGHMAVVGAPRSGKSTVLRTLLAASIWTHSPAEVRFYCVDMGGGGLRAFAGAPHVGDVAGKLEREKVRRLVRQVQAELEERELRFRLAALDSIADVRARRARGELGEGDDFPDVFLVVDGWGAFRQEFEGLDQEIEQLAGAGLSYGIHVALSANRWAEMRPGLRDNVGSRLELRLNDPIESEVDRRAAAALPPDRPGRGVIPGPLHFQAALPRVDGRRDDADLPEAIGALVAEAREQWRGPAAPPVRMLPLELRSDELPPVSGAGLVVGIEEMRLEPVALDFEGGDPHFMVFGDAESGKTTLLRGLVRELGRRHGPDEARVLLVDLRRSLLDVAGDDVVTDYAPTSALAAEAVSRVAATLSERLPSGDVGREELLRGPSWSGPRHYVIVDDYDLVGSPGANPLERLADLLALGRDIGLHVVLARRVGGVARASFEPFFQRLRELGSPGLILSGDPQEGPVLGNQKAAALPPGRGFLVRRHQRTTQIQVVLTPAEALDRGRIER